VLWKRAFSDSVSHSRGSVSAARCESRTKMSPRGSPSISNTGRSLSLSSIDGTFRGSDRSRRRVPSNSKLATAASKWIGRYIDTVGTSMMCMTRRKRPFNRSTQQQGDALRYAYTVKQEMECDRRCKVSHSISCLTTLFGKSHESLKSSHTRTVGLVGATSRLHRVVLAWNYIF
jgi:hypothetical protein